MLAFLVSIVFISAPAALAEDLAASVEIPVTCGITLEPTTIDFGMVQTGGTSDEKTTDVTNQGSFTGSVYVKGTDWTTDSLSFGVGSTMFGPTTTDSPLSAADQFLADIENGMTQSAHFKVSIPLGQRMGSYTQTITFTSACDEV
ncbi:hypothetical protein A3K63_03480 [Candidatus Micrarchaeota archaeon RBG_16_49_10]|nr:MAG: hypothetical protein A3K63_03480 [Candidatus Micrarchaeota archaeon RBG_16_49_10]